MQPSQLARSMFISYLAVLCVISYVLKTPVHLSVLRHDDDYQTPMEFLQRPRDKCRF